MAIAIWSKQGIRTKSTKAVLRFVFSEVGLVLVIVTYIVLGGLLFRAIECDSEVKQADTVREMAKDIEMYRTTMKLRILEIKEQAIKYNWNRSDAVPMIKSLLDQYHMNLTKAIGEGYDGTVHDPDHENYGWNIWSSILFTTSILTTIGFGHVCPKTEIGKLVVMLYAVLAVPLMSIFLIKIGGVVGTFIRYVYHTGFCFSCKKRRYAAHISEKRRKADWSSHYEHVVLEKNTENSPKFLLAMIVSIYLIIGTAVFGIWEKDWSGVNALYMSFITLSTIGFGDLVPGIGDIGTTDGKVRLMVAFLYIMIGLAVLSMGMDMIARKLEEELQRKKDDEEKQQMLEEQKQAALNLPKEPVRTRKMTKIPETIPQKANQPEKITKKHNSAATVSQDRNLLDVDKKISLY